MTTQTKCTRRKLSLLELAGELDNVAKACRIMGYSRTQFYEIRRQYQTYGSAGLMDKLAGAPSPHPNRIPEEIEIKVVEMTLQRPTYGAARISNQLRLAQVQVSAGGVRNVWLRNNLESRLKRLLALEKRHQEEGFLLNEEQIRLLEKNSPEFRERHVESSRPGELLSQDSFLVGCLKGIGRVYMQAVVDVYCSFGFAKLYTSKLPVTTVDVLNDRALPFYDEQGLKVEAVLTDNGREYCGREDRHPYELFLGLEEIDHRRTKVRHPQTNGFVERFHKTLLDEHFRIMGRTKFYDSVEEMQLDLDEFMEHYNWERSHMGYRLKGLTPGAKMREYLQTGGEAQEAA